MVWRPEARAEAILRISNHHMYFQPKKLSTQKQYHHSSPFPASPPSSGSKSSRITSSLTSSTCGLPPPSTACVKAEPHGYRGRSIQKGVFVLTAPGTPLWDVRHELREWAQDHDLLLVHGDAPLAGEPGGRVESQSALSSAEEL